MEDTIFFLASDSQRFITIFFEEWNRGVSFWTIEIKNIHFFLPTFFYVYFIQNLNIYINNIRYAIIIIAWSKNSLKKITIDEENNLKFITNFLLEFWSRRQQPFLFS